MFRFHLIQISPERRFRWNYAVAISCPAIISLITRLTPKNPRVANSAGIDREQALISR
jgi:hypothetical protein